MIKKFLYLMLCICIATSSLTLPIYAEDIDEECLLMGDFELKTEAKVDEDADGYLFSDAVTSSYAIITADVKIPSDDMYGTVMSIFSRNGKDILKLYLNRDNIYVESGEETPATVSLGRQIGSSFDMEIMLDIDEQMASINCGGIKKTLEIPEEFIDISGFRLAADGTTGIGFRHIELNNLKVIPSDDAGLEENLEEIPVVEKPVVLVEVYKQDFSAYKQGSDIGTGIKAAEENGNVYAELKAGESKAWITSLGKEYKDDIYTFSFDYMIEKDSTKGFQLQFGGCMNFEPQRATADQEQLVSATERNVNIAPDGIDAGVWYNVTLSVDPAGQIFDVYFDGEKTASGVRFRNAQTNSLKNIYIIPLGGTDEGLRHIRFDNFVVSQGGKPVTSLEDATAERTQMPTTKQFETTKDIQKMKNAFAILPGNPYMLASDTRALYDWKDNTIVPFVENEVVFVPAELVHEIIDKNVITVEKNGRAYCTLEAIAEATELKISTYDDMYFISRSKKLFSEKDAEYAAKVRERFPDVLPVTKPKSYDFVTMFNNDMTGTGSTDWEEKAKLNKADPYYPRDVLMLQVEEVGQADVDVQIMAALMGSVQFWKGRNDPREQHMKWRWEEFRQYPTTGGWNYVARGGDLFEDYINKTHEYNQKAFVSVRVNDWHHLDTAWSNNPVYDSISKFYYDNKDTMSFKEKNSPTLNWKYPEVREYMITKIRDLCENYDIDGLELDFLRYNQYFDNTISETEKFEIMTDFVKQVRDILDETSIDGKYRYLQARVDLSVGRNRGYGLDLTSMSNAGVDCFIASAFYNTSCQADIRGMRAAIGEDKFLAVEITNTMDEIAALTDSGGDNRSFIRCSREALYTAAYRALSQGADGVYAFNFQYYREFGAARDIRGPFNEPPFDVFEKFKDMDFLATQPFHYWIDDYNNLDTHYKPNGYFQSGLFAGKRKGANIDICVPEERLSNDSKLRFYFDDVEKLNNCQFKVSFNGVDLVETDDWTLHYETEFNQHHGEAENYKCYIIPAGVMKNGNNYFDITQLEGESIKPSRTDILIK